jgi:hypothetical protein
MDRFGNIANLGRNGFSAPSEVAHQGQSRDILGLGIESDDLSPDSEHGDWVVVVAADFCCHGVNSQPAPFGVVGDEGIIGLYSFLICEGCAFVASGTDSLDSFRGLKNGCHFGHLLEGQVELLLKLKLELQFASSSSPVEILELNVFLAEISSREPGFPHETAQFDLIGSLLSMVPSGVFLERLYFINLGVSLDYYSPSELGQSSAN